MATNRLGMKIEETKGFYGEPLFVVRTKQGRMARINGSESVHYTREAAEQAIAREEIDHEVACGVAKRNFNKAARAFTASPSAGCWSVLKVAMYAYQQVTLNGVDFARATAEATSNDLLRFN